MMHQEVQYHPGRLKLYATKTLLIGVVYTYATVPESTPRKKLITRQDVEYPILQISSNISVPSGC